MFSGGYYICFCIISAFKSKTGENGIFSMEEFALLTTASQMEFVTPEEIAKFANALGAPYFVDSSADPYIVDHSSALFIVNPAGAFAAVFTAPHEIEPIAADLDELLSKN